VTDRRGSTSPQEAAYAALLAGANAYQAAQPVDDSIKRASVLRAGWLHDLEFALDWAGELLQLAPLTPTNYGERLRYFLMQ
jgi:hypothetical protein